jgi:signal transduction histidine kinase
MGEGGTANDISDAVLRRIVETTPIAAAILRLKDAGGLLQVTSRQAIDSIEWSTWQNRSIIAERVMNNGERIVAKVPESDSKGAFGNLPWLANNTIKLVACFPLKDPSGSVQGTLTLCCLYDHKFDSRSEHVLQNLTHGLIRRATESQSTDRILTRQRLLLHDVRVAMGNAHAQLQMYEGYVDDPVRRDLAVKEARDSVSLILDLTKSSHADISSSSDLSLQIDKCLPLRDNSKKITLQKMIEPNVAIRLPASDLLLIVRTLLQNAVTAIEESERASGIIITSAISGPNSFILSIRDDGAGVNEIVREHLFRLPASGWTKRRGSGQGLSLAQKLASHYGARIEMIPREDGAQFNLVIPSALREGGES